MAMGININTSSIGERIVVGIAVLGLVAEMLSDNTCNAPQPEPMTIEACVQVCAWQEEKVHRVESWACECRESEPPKELP